MKPLTPLKFIIGLVVNNPESTPLRFRIILQSQSSLAELHSLCLNTTPIAKKGDKGIVVSNLNFDFTGLSKFNLNF